jgi:hypothetical protein
MQDNINDIIGQKAFDQVEKLDAKMAALEDRFTKTAQAAVSMAASLGDFSKIKDLTDQVNKLQTNLSSLTKQQQDYTLGAAQLKLAKSRTAAALKEEAILVSENSSAYEKLDVRQKQAERSAKQIGLTIGMNSAEYKKASTEANNLLNQLKAMDATLGNARRNVGNYGQAVFSLSQVFRELPAFTYSAQQGILAISNNLPILVDNFQATAKAVNETTGKINGVSGALGIFAKSIFSFGNIFTIAIGLFTIYYKEIVSFISGTDSAADSVRKFNESLEGMLSNLKEINDEIEFGNTHIERETKLLIARAKAKGDNLEVERLEKLGIQQRIDLIDAELKKVNESRKIYQDLQRIKNVNSSAVPQTKEDIQKAINETEKLYSQLIDKRSALLIDLQIKGLGGAPSKSGGRAGGRAGGGKDASGVNSPIWLTLAENWGVGKGDGWKKALEDAYKDMYPRIVDEVERLTIENVLPEEEAILLNSLLLGRNKGKLTPEQLKLIEEANRRLKEAIVAGGFDIASSIGSGVSSQELQAIDFRERSLRDYYDSELRFIEQSGLAEYKKAKLKQKLDAETAAKQKQIERDRITALRKAALYQKGLDIAQAIANVVLAVTKKGVTTPDAIAAAIAGAAAVARIIATPLPQYAKGRKGGKAEMALVGEKGTELIRHSDGSLHVTPNKPTVTFLPEGADVIPNHELLKQAAYVKLQGVNNITPDKYGAALLAAFEDNTAEVRELKNIMASKDYSLKVKTLQGYNDYIKSKLR